VKKGDGELLPRSPSVLGEEEERNEGGSKGWKEGEKGRKVVYINGERSGRSSISSTTTREREGPVGSRRREG
jgi:hypothetical protein